MQEQENTHDNSFITDYTKADSKLLRHYTCNIRGYSKCSFESLLKDFLDTYRLCDTREKLRKNDFDLEGETDFKGYEFVGTVVG